MKPLGWLGVLVTASLLAGCDDPPKKNHSSAPAAEQASPASSVTEAPKPAGPPLLSIDDIGPRIGSERALLEQRDGRAQLTAAFEKQREHFAGKPSTLAVDRKAKLSHVAAVLEELGKLGSKPVTIKTETRKDFSAEIAFIPENAVGNAPACSVVATITEDRGTAVWKLSGGTAGKRRKGMAGPDLTMTGESIVRLAKACSDSRVIFVGGAEDVEWGLVYDLAASTKTYDKAYFDSVVFLGTTPVPGRRVELKN